MGLLGRMFNIGKAKVEGAVEAAEDKNAVALAKQDVEEMKKLLNEATVNVGKIKGRIMGYERDLKAKKSEKKDLEEKAVQLLEAGAEEVASEVAIQIEAVEAEVSTLTAALAQQKNLEKQHSDTQNTLRQKINQAESQMRQLQTMNEVEKANAALTEVNQDGANSALSRFENRLKKQQERLDASTATIQAQKDASPEALDDKINAALGKSAGSDTLARLKAKMKNKD